MPLIKRILKHLKLREGERLTVYTDSLGYPTVGVGHLVKPEDKLILGDKITQQQSDAFLMKDMQKALEAAKKQAKQLNIETDDFILALTSVNFQLGTEWPRVFHGSYPKLIAGDWQGAIKGFQNSRWARQTPVRVEDFVKAIEKAYNTPEDTEVSQLEGEENMTLDLNVLNGYKTHILGGFAILVGVLKILTDIPSIEAVNVLGVSDAWTLITTGWATIAGRSIASKFQK